MPQSITMAQLAAQLKKEVVAPLYALIGEEDLLRDAALALIKQAVLRGQFDVTAIPQIPNIGYFVRSGGDTSEQGSDSAEPHARFIADDSGRIMVFMTHNTDISDSWEREADDPTYFYTFGPRGYAFGINVLLHAMTH